MKAIICAVRGDVHIHTPGSTKWEICQCGQTGAYWEDPNAGKLIVACRSYIDKVFVLGLNNQLLLPAITRGGSWADVRRWHDSATAAPGYIFDKSNADCWSVVFRPGQTSDTRWATEQEYIECFPN